LHGSCDMSALEALTESAVPIPSTNPDLILAFSGPLPKELEAWAAKRGHRIERSPSVAVDPALLKAQHAKWAIVDLDVQPPDRDPIALVKALAAEAPAVAIVVVTSRSDDIFIRGLIDAGIKAVVIKRALVSELALAMTTVIEGRSFISGIVSHVEAALTPREQEVLELMADGRANREIGERLAISVKTVEAHRARIFRKLGASNVADAIMLAIRGGLLFP
jgi:DNA-binding NarL/FixJ family response regulator